jgi:nicotinate-nucleotide--dimethylbenzimidazole phosphoribosyltransferase
LTQRNKTHLAVTGIGSSYFAALLSCGQRVVKKCFLQRVRSERLSMKSPAATFDEVRAVAASLPGSGFTWPSRVEHPRIVLYAATHGIAAHLPGGSTQDVTELVEDIVAGRGQLHELAEQADADLRLYDLALDRPTRDLRIASALDEADACRAAAYGMMAVEPGVDIFVVSALGVGAEMAGTALSEALARGGDPLELLAAKGGPDIAAILGVILASRLASMPLILDGIAACAAAAVAGRLSADALAHCRIATGDRVSESLGLSAILSGSAESPLSGARALISAQL